MKKLIPGVLMIIAVGAVMGGDQFFKYAEQKGIVEGVRGLELIRPDILSITVDGSITGNGNGPGNPEQFQKPDVFTISSPNDASFANGVHPESVERRSFEKFNSVLPGMYMTKIFWWHTYYLYLGKPLKSGSSYRVTVNRGIPASYKTYADIAYNEKSTMSEVFKINQICYSSKSAKRYAYLGWWAGTGGKVDYSAFSEFMVVDESNGNTVFNGTVSLRKRDDSLSGEDVYEMDISPLVPGRYHIYIPEFARSETFYVGGKQMQELYFHTMRGFFHQRCGQEFREPWTWVKKPACHTEVWHSGNLVSGPGKILCPYKKDTPYQPKPGEEKKTFRGGYHDAADFDTFSYHLPATSQILTAFEWYPEFFCDGDLNFPESGNRIPDVLDEAAWGLLFHLENQNEDGSVPLGRGNECDAFSQNTGGKKTPFGVLPPRSNSTETFAAVAAQFGRLIRPYDPELSARHIEAAEKAYAFARNHKPTQTEGRWTPNRHKPGLFWAAAELFSATGKSMYNDDCKKYFAENKWEEWWLRDMRTYAYVRITNPEVDTSIQERLKQYIISHADKVLSNTLSTPYRMGAGPVSRPWGGTNPITFTDRLLRAYEITKDQKYLDAASLNADFLLGCNPISQTYITGMGYRHPERPEISFYLYSGPDATGKMVKGITIYGLGPVVNGWQPRHPGWRNWRDLWGFGSEQWSEFTVTQTVGPAAMLFQVLYAVEGPALKRTFTASSASKPGSAQAGHHISWIPKKEAVKKIDAGLLKTVVSEVEAGKRVMFYVNMAKADGYISNIDKEGNLDILIEHMGMSFKMKWDTMKADEKAGISISLAENGSKKARIMAAFYLLADGRKEEADKHLLKVGKRLADMEVFFN